MAPLVDQLVARYDKVLLRKVDLTDRKSAAAAQATSAYGLTGIPFFCVYDAKGELVGKVAGSELGALEWGIKKALGP